MLVVYATLSVLSGLVALGFWFQGVALVLPFALLELTAVGLAFLVFARHATDQERLTITTDRVLYELEWAGRTSQTEFKTGWVSVRVVPQRVPIELKEGRKTVMLGRFLRPGQHGEIRRQIEAALAHQRVSVA